MRVLIVEDEPNLGRQLRSTLEGAGYAVDLATDGEDGHYLGATENYDAVVLDLGLPEIDGLTVLDRWRKEGRKMPVLVLTARDSWSDKVAGLDAGADDYLAKPFQTEELIARLRALIRRAAGVASSELDAGDIRLDTRSGKVTKAGEPVKLTAQEYKLLSYLMHHKGKVVSRTELIEHIYDQDFDRDSNTIEVFVTRIRKKLGADVITTIRGLGYSLEDSPRLNDAAVNGRCGEGQGTPRGVADPAHDRRRGDLDRRASADRWLCARPSAVARHRPEFRPAARICPERDDRRIGNRSRWRGSLHPAAGRPAVPRALFRAPISRLRARARKHSLPGRCGIGGLSVDDGHNDVELHKRDSFEFEDEPLRILERDVILPGSNVRWRFQVAQSRDAIDGQIRELRTTLIRSFAALGAGLLVLAALQAFYGLWPLRRVRREVASIRGGTQTRISEDFPREVEPLVDEINELLAHSEEQAEEARRHAGNLAHALKTPLTVITNAATAHSADLNDTVIREAAVMRRQVDHHLARARAIGRRASAQARATVWDSVRGGRSSRLDAISQRHHRHRRRQDCTSAS